MLDGCAPECLKNGVATVDDWLATLLNVCFVMNMMSFDCISACLVPLHKCKGDKCDCICCGSISTLSIVGKIYDKILVKRTIEDTKGRKRDIIQIIQTKFTSWYSLLLTVKKYWSQQASPHLCKQKVDLNEQGDR